MLVNLGVTVDVKPSQDGNELALGGHVAHRPQKAFQVAAIDVVEVPVIDRLERLLCRVVVRVLQLSFHQIGLQMQPHLLEKELAERPFDSHGQISILWQIRAGSLGERRPEEGVVAG